MIKEKGWDRLICLMTLGFLIPSCAGGGGSGGEGGGLALVSSNLRPNESRPINVPLQFEFNKEVDLAGVNLTTIQINPVPAAVPGAPEATTPQGEFFLKDSRTVIFQPNCPTSDNPGWGFLPGNEVAPVQYQVLIPGRNDTDGPVLLASDGSALQESVSFLFQTSSPPASVLQDPRPTQPPTIVNLEELPPTLGLNLFSNPNELMAVRFDQPLLRESVGPRAIELRMPDEILGGIPLPSEILLSQNCTQEGGAVVEILPLGILPPGARIDFFLSPDLAGLGGAEDSRTEALLFHQATVDVAASPQLDALVERFDDDQNMDPAPVSIYPLARWGEGRLEAAPLFPGSFSEVEILIGGDSANGKNVLFDTTGGTLKDQDGNTIFFGGGVLEVKRFTIEEDGEFRAIGPNPLVIRAREGIRIVERGELILSGQDGQNADNVNAAQNPTQGGDGRAGGGRGGNGSPLTNQSSPGGDPGNGSFNIPGAGAGGGHSAFKQQNYKNTKPGGGGGGNWNITEVQEDGSFGTFCYGPRRYCVDCNTCKPACGGTGASYNSNGEPGTPGGKRETGSGQQCLINDQPVDQVDVITNLCHAQGGAAGPAIFDDADPGNNFFGRKPLLTEGELSIIEGEQAEWLGGQGGGGGGDNVPSLDFPSGPTFSRKDYKGGAGGGGGGIVLLQSPGLIEINGKIKAEGGDGGFGEIFIRSGTNQGAAAGGGGGAGGAIILETQEGIVIGKRAELLARGGNRGHGTGTIPGFASGGTFCRKNTTAARGGAGGKGLILFRLPFEEGSEISCGGITQPRIRPGALTVAADNGTPYEIFCERNLTLASELEPPTIRDDIYKRCDPFPQILIPEFGPNSIGQSQWTYLGMPGDPLFEFGGVENGTGILDTGFQRTLASGEAGSLEREGGKITLENAELADLIASAPATLFLDGFQVNPQDPVFPILSASVSGDRITLELDISRGQPGPAGNWSLLRRNVEPLVDRIGEEFPESAQARIFFQGADPKEPGSLEPDPATFTEFLADIRNLVDPETGKAKPLVRFRVLFDSNLGGGEFDPLLPRPGFGFVKLPFSFNR